MNPRTIAAIATIGLSLGACAESETPLEWQADCVGRLVFDLPGAAEIATYEIMDLLSRSKAKRLSFSDGQSASWGSGGFLGTAKTISGNTDDEVQAYIEKRIQIRDGYRRKQYGNKSYRDLDANDKDGFSFRADDVDILFVRNGRTLFSWSGYSGISQKEAEKNYKTVLSGLRPRPLFDVPHEPGVCLPYTFIRDDGTTPRHIGMTYRLVDHPDITIWLEDSDAAAYGPHTKNGVLEPEYTAAYFWTNRYNAAKAFESEWSDDFKYTDINGRKAVETFVKLQHYDADTIDYGYLAVIRGDPDAKEDTPDVMLYVIRNADNATKRGITPMPKDAFLNLARQIAHSVKKRPVQ